jgi:chromate transporter
MYKLFSLALVFALISVMAIGGGTGVLPEMERLVVHRFHWMGDQQFRDIYSLGQVSPGPNMLMVMVIGYRLAGVAGAAVVGLAFFLPDCIMTFFVNRLWSRFSESQWRIALLRGLAPLTIGLMLSGTYTLARLSIFPPAKVHAPTFFGELASLLTLAEWDKSNLVRLAIAAATFGILSWRRVNPLLLISASGLVYLIFTIR